MGAFVLRKQVQRKHDQIFAVTEALKKLPLFDGCSKHTVNKICEAADIVIYSEDSEIISQDEAVEHVYFLLRGIVFIIRYELDGKIDVLNFHTSGEGLNCEFVFAAADECFTAIAQRDNTTMLRLRKTDLLQFMATDAAFAVKYSKYLCALNGILKERINFLKRKFAADNLLEHMLQLQKKVKGQCFGIYGKITHEHLAAYIGGTRETVTRALGEMKNDGIVEISGRNIMKVHGKKSEMNLGNFSNAIVSDIVPFKTWKIPVGTHESGTHIMKDLNACGRRVLGGWALSSLRNKLNRMDLPEEDVVLGGFSNELLGFGKGAFLKDTFERASELGFNLCHHEHGLYLGLNYSHQPQGEVIHVAMSQIIGPGGGKAIYRLGNGLNGRYISCVGAKLDSFWGPGRIFVFELP
jgi:CRP/FNR family transcriptional regulator